MRNRNRRPILAWACDPGARAGGPCYDSPPMCARARYPGLPAVVAAVLLGAGLAAPATGQLNEEKPQGIEGVGVTEHLDVQIPLDLEFTDSTGEKVTLGQIFDGNRPLILTMNYSDCPKLCSLQLNALVDAMHRMPLKLGEEYQVLTVSIDPLETPERAQLTRRKYLKDYGKAGAAAGWRFLVTRDEDRIHELADTVGFHYKFIPERREYNHVAVLMICTSGGRVSRYLGGVNYDPNTLRLSLIEASEGKVGSPMDQFLLYCFHYDPTEGRYAPAAFRIMQLAGLLTVVVFGGVMSVFWLRERRKSRGAAPAAESVQEPAGADQPPTGKEGT
jgi:protein SCO1